MDSYEKSAAADVLTIDVVAAKDILDSGCGYLDVRTVEEFREGHVDTEKIFNIPYMLSTPEGRVKNPDFLKQVTSVCKKDDQYVVGCRSGVRSLLATADLLSVGFKQMKNMGGGHLAWVQKGLKVKVDDKPAADADHQTEL